MFFDVECGDMSLFSHRETCLPVPKRGHVHALQIVWQLVHRRRIASGPVVNNFEVKAFNTLFFQAN